MEYTNPSNIEDREDDKENSNHPMKEMFDEWYNYVNSQEEEKEVYSSDVYIVTWIPKIKWFRPPMWKIFKWAYRIEITKYTNVFPAAINKDKESADKIIECTSSTVIPEEVKDLAEKLINQYYQKEE